ncbi:MAG: ArnT family glycosyltransferase [Candidatus Eisenbacteria bacterium]
MTAAAAGGHREERFVVLAVLLLALMLRVPALDRFPPALHQDEASNGVDAWSLWTTGADRAGRVWPVFLEGFGDGDNRTSLYAILAVPFVALLGPGAWATRLPAALAGAWTVLAAYLLARRLWGRTAGITAAVLLAACPWHLWLSRFGHEASLTPAFLVSALLLVSGRGGAGAEAAGEERPVSATRWGLAGVVLAAGLYSYPSYRLFLPLLLAGSLLAWAGPRPATRAARLAFLGGLVMAALPLAVATLRHPDRLLARPEAASVFGNVEPLGSALLLAAWQYVQHFGPSFLFLRGDANPLQSLPGGSLLAIEAITLPIGIWAAVRRWREPWSRLLLLWLLLCPLASALSLGDRPEYVPHALRAAVGLPVFQLLGGLGAAAAVARLRERSRNGAKPASVAIAIGTVAVAVNAVLVLALALGPWSRSVAPLYHSAWPPAMRFLRENRDRFGSAVLTAEGNPQAYVYALLYGVLTPREYRDAEKEVESTVTFHLVHRAGRLSFLHGPADLEAAKRLAGQTIWVVVVPGQLRSGRLLASFPYPDGTPGLEVREIELRR